MQLTTKKRRAVIYTIGNIHVLCSMDISFFPKALQYIVRIFQNFLRKNIIRAYEQLADTLSRERNMTTATPPVIAIEETNKLLMDIFSDNVNITTWARIVSKKRHYAIQSRSLDILNKINNTRAGKVEKYINIWWQNSLYDINKHRMIRYAIVKLHYDCLISNQTFAGKQYASLEITNKNISGNIFKELSRLDVFFDNLINLMYGEVIWALNVLRLRGVFPKWRDALQSILRYKYPLDNQSLKPGPPATYLFVPDGPSGTNTKAALPVAKALHDSGTPCIVLTNSRVTVEAMARAGVEAIQIPTIFTGVKSLVAASKAKSLTKAWVSDRRRQTGSAFDRNFYYMDLNIPVYITIAKAVQEACRKIFACRRPTTILTLTETHPFCIAAALEAREHGACWVGWLHMLIMDIPDYRYFPADYHLFYGDHAKNIFDRYAPTAGPALSIGSPIYEQAFGRARDADLAAVRRMLPEWDGCPLIVVGTENRDNQLVEITATLTALHSLDNVHTVVKLHPDDDLKTFLDLIARLELPPHRFAVIKACDVDALLHAADVLITTFSNIIINAAILGTAIISHNYTDAFGVDFADAGVGFKAISPEALLTLLTRLLGDSAFRAKHVEASRRAVRQFSSEHGNSSAVAIAQVMAELHVGDDAIFSPAAPFQEIGHD